MITKFNSYIWEVCNEDSFHFRFLLINELVAEITDFKVAHNFYI